MILASKNWDFDVQRQVCKILKNTLKIQSPVPKKKRGGKEEVDEAEGTLALTVLNELKIKH